MHSAVMIGGTWACTSRPQVDTIGHRDRTGTVGGAAELHDDVVSELHEFRVVRLADCDSFSQRPGQANGDLRTRQRG